MNAHGMFVELENGIDGFIDFESLRDDYYFYNEQLMMAFGRRSNHKYQLGDKVKVMVDRVDVESYQIIFALLNDIKPSKIIDRKNLRKNRRGKKYGRN